VASDLDVKDSFSSEPAIHQLQCSLYPSKGNGGTVYFLTRGTAQKVRSRQLASMRNDLMRETPPTDSK
jgi:hypothetical protein